MSDETKQKAVDKAKALVDEATPKRRAVAEPKTTAPAEPQMPENAAVALPEVVETPQIDADAPFASAALKADAALADQDKVREFQAAQAREQQEAAEREIAKLRAEEEKAGREGVAGDGVFIFMAKYPQLILYVKCGEFVRDRDNNRVEIDTRIDFRNGVFQANAEQAAALRKHPRFNRLFREEKSAQNSAIRQALAQKRDALVSPTQAGTTASTDGSENYMLTQDRKLADAEASLIDL